ncbi:MAG: DUF192 domain-containing protein [Nitrospira sp.]|nr:DUF192 domain-containing protein [Nitrospira sp.]
MGKNEVSTLLQMSSHQNQASDREQKKKRIIMMILLALLLMSASVFLVERKESSVIVVTFPSGVELEAEVADTPEKLLFGLAFREALPTNGGMLYIFEENGLHRVTTREYRFPIDILWVDESHHVVHLLEQAEPCAKDPCPLFGPPPEAARYVIQTESGFIKKAGVAKNDELKYALRL